MAGLGLEAGEALIEGGGESTGGGGIVSKLLSAGKSMLGMGAKDESKSLTQKVTNVVAAHAVAKPVEAAIDKMTPGAAAPGTAGTDSEVPNYNGNLSLTQFNG